MMRIQNILDGGQPPVIAIRRGLRPAEAVAIGEALLSGGIRIIEVPFNSPEPLVSIELLASRFGMEALIGAGTVRSVAEVESVASAGGRLIVSPHTDAEVIARAVVHKMDCLPGCLSPTEAFTAIREGATDLKIFPAATLGPGHLRALREVLPRNVRVWAVGGTSANDLAAWVAAGACGIGVGGALYVAGDMPQQVRERAIALRSVWWGQRNHAR